MASRPPLGNRLASRVRLDHRPPVAVGVAVQLVSVAAATAAIYPLKQVARVESLAVVYLPAALLVSTIWGLWAGLGTPLRSWAAFNWFHLPPVGRFTIADSRNWVGLAAFTLIAIVVSAMAEVARAGSLDAERRRAEADLAA